LPNVLVHCGLHSRINLAHTRDDLHCARYPARWFTPRTPGCARTRTLPFVTDILDSAAFSGSVAFGDTRLPQFWWMDLERSDLRFSGCAFTLYATSLGFGLLDRVIVAHRSLHALISFYGCTLRLRLQFSFSSMARLVCAGSRGLRFAHTHQFCYGCGLCCYLCRLDSLFVSSFGYVLHTRSVILSGWISDLSSLYGFLGYLRLGLDTVQVTDSSVALLHYTGYLLDLTGWFCVHTHAHARNTHVLHCGLCVLSFFLLDTP